MVPKKIHLTSQINRNRTHFPLQNKRAGFPVTRRKTFGDKRRMTRECYHQLALFAKNLSKPGSLEARNRNRDATGVWRAPNASRLSCPLFTTSRLGAVQAISRNFFFFESRHATPLSMTHWSASCLGRGELLCRVAIIFKEPPRQLNAHAVISLNRSKAVSRRRPHCAARATCLINTRISNLVLTSEYPTWSFSSTPLKIVTKVYLLWTFDAKLFHMCKTSMITTLLTKLISFMAL